MTEVSPDNLQNTFRPLFEDWQADCAKLSLNWDDARLETLVRFYEALSVVNAHTNLTRIDTPKDFLYRHVLDSLNTERFIPNGASLADIGSGGGFPAFPLAIYRPDIQIIAIESIGKKAHFISESAKSLGLKNLTVVSERCEALGQMPTFRGEFDRVTARAVAPLRVLLELAMPLLKDPKPGQDKAQLLAIKGSKLSEELDAAKNALNLLCTEHVATHANPVEGLEHSVVAVFEKRKATPKAYPREVGLPKKLPL